MFSFFRKSKKDNEKKKESQAVKEATGSVQGKDVCKNNLQTTIQKSEIAYESAPNSLPNYPSECELRKNVSNAPSIVETVYEKIDANSDTKSTNNSAGSPSPDIIATMWDSGASKPVVSERRGSCVKPCGHGTTAITPRIPVITGPRSNNSSPSASPILEIRRQFRIKGIENVGVTEEPDVKKPKVNDDTDTDTEEHTVTASVKLQLDIPAKTLENGIDGQTYVVFNSN